MVIGGQAAKNDGQGKNSGWEAAVHNVIQQDDNKQLLPDKQLEIVILTSNGLGHLPNRNIRVDKSSAQANDLQHEVTICL